MDPKQIENRTELAEGWNGKNVQQSIEAHATDKEARKEAYSSLMHGQISSGFPEKKEEAHKDLARGDSSPEVGGVSVSAERAPAA